MRRPEGCRCWRLECWLGCGLKPGLEFSSELLLVLVLLLMLLPLFLALASLLLTDTRQGQLPLLLVAGEAARSAAAPAGSAPLLPLGGAGPAGAGPQAPGRGPSVWRAAEGDVVRSWER